MAKLGCGMVRLSVLCAGALVLAAGGCAPAQTPDRAQSPAPAADGAGQFQRGEGRPYEVLGSQVWDVPDPASGRAYQVFVNLPASYESEPQRRYPVLYVTDADYAFPIARQVSRRLNGEGPKIEEFILVGLSYARGDGGGDSRGRDYTPTANGPRSASSKLHGGGGAYQAYLRDQVMPFVAGRFRTDPARSYFLGHSYGGLLGAQILLTEPSMFAGYVLGSPSLWFDQRHMFGVEKAYAQAHRDLPAKVYIYVGEYEAARPGDPRFNASVDMVGDARAFESALKSRDYPGLVLKTEVLPDEDHLSVAPRGLTHGLKFLLPAP